MHLKMYAYLKIYNKWTELSIEYYGYILLRKDVNMEAMILLQLPKCWDYKNAEPLQMCVATKSWQQNYIGDILY